MAIIWMEGFDHYPSIRSTKVAGVQTLKTRTTKSEMIKYLEDENQSLTQQLHDAYEHNASAAQQQQIRTTALHLALAHRLNDTATNADVLANAASYEQFIGGYDQPSPPTAEVADEAEREATLAE